MICSVRYHLKSENIKLLNMYYSENPALGRRTVTTFDGNTEYRFNCRKIRNEYYVKNKTCFLIDNTWYRINSGLISLDSETGEMKLIKGSNMIQGIIAFEDKKPILGYFTPNPYKNCPVVIDNNSYTALNTEILILAGFVEDFSTGTWFDSKTNNVRSLQTPKNILNHTNKGYNIEDNREEFQRKIQLLNNYTPEYSKDLRRYAKLLGDTTFGIEIECAKGYLPDHIQNQTGIVICRDGSLADENGQPGPEFVTVPLSGAKGLQTIVTLGKELPKRTEIDIRCSLHAHLGNLPTTRLYLVSLYKLAYKIQNEIFQMFPFYKTNPEGIKKKNYNQKLPSLNILNIPRGLNKEEFDAYIDDAYKAIFSWLAEGYFPDKKHNRKNKMHPVNAKWNRHSRYYWINFMNTIFSERNTVEFRLHTPTTNGQKMINWLYICNAIVKYANTHANKILLSKCEISLDDILDYYRENYNSRGAFLSSYLQAYVKERKEKCLISYQNKDYIGIDDLKNDKQYEFTFNNVTHLF